jgi:hypothetical protein
MEASKAVPPLCVLSGIRTTQGGAVFGLLAIVRAGQHVDRAAQTACPARICTGGRPSAWRVEVLPKIAAYEADQVLVRALARPGHMRC